MAQRIYTVLGVISPDGATFQPAGVLAGDCKHLLCDSGFPGAWGYIGPARDAHAATQAAIDSYELDYLGGHVGSVQVEVVSTPDRRVGRVGRWRAQRRLTGKGGWQGGEDSLPFV